MDILKLSVRARNLLLRTSEVKKNQPLTSVPEKSLSVKVFKSDGTFEEFDLSYQEIISNSAVCAKIFGEFHPDVKRYLSYVVFGSYAPKQIILKRRFMTVVNFAPVRAILLYDRIVLCLNTTAAHADDVVSALDYLRRQYVKAIKNQSEVDREKDDFLLAGTECALITALGLVKWDFVECKRMLEEEKDKPKLLRLKKLQFAEMALQRLIDLMHARISALNTLLENEENPNMSKRNRGSSVFMLENDTEERVTYILSQYSFFLVKIEEFLEDVLFQQTLINIMLNVDETRLFQVNLVLLIIMAASTLGIFLTALVTMNLSVPDFMADNGNFPNSFQTNATALQSPFVPFTMTVVAIMLLWGGFHGYNAMILWNKSKHVGDAGIL